MNFFKDNELELNNLYIREYCFYKTKEIKSFKHLKRNSRKDI